MNVLYLKTKPENVSSKKFYFFIIFS